MAGIFTRKTLGTIINDENLTPEERVDQIFSLYGRAVDSGYIARSTAEAEKQAAVETALAAQPQQKDPQPINVKESDEYKQLQAQFDSFKTRTEARTSDEFKDVKPKFFDAVYDHLDHGEKHKPYSEQLSELQQQYEEFFTAPVQPKDEPQKPQFGAPTEGKLPSGDEGQSFMAHWGFVPKKS